MPWLNCITEVLFTHGEWSVYKQMIAYSSHVLLKSPHPNIFSLIVFFKFIFDYYYKNAVFPLYLFYNLEGFLKIVLRIWGKEKKTTIVTASFSR